MIIECLVRREGPTTIEMEKIKYLFTPIPGIAKKGVPTTSIADVTMAEHLEYMLKRPSFREYDPDQTKKDQLQFEKDLGVYSGFSIEKYQDKGYIVLDQRNKKHLRFLDNTGRWKEEGTGLTAFPTEYQAYEALKEEIEMGVEEPPIEDKKPKRAMGAQSEA